MSIELDKDDEFMQWLRKEMQEAESERIAKEAAFMLEYNRPRNRIGRAIARRLFTLAERLHGPYLPLE